MNAVNVPRAKSGGVFVLDHAQWPAFLVDGGGTIRAANEAAVEFFGPKMASDSTLLTAVLAEGNEPAPEQFLALWERSPVPALPVKFRGKGATLLTFSTHLCSLHRDGEKRFLFQLFPQAPAPVVETKAPPTDAGLAHKQKLDCALQLARTVALDFNNALTSILGHASLLLAKMEPDDPRRASLIEVEKAAEKAAETAQQLAAFSRQEREPQGLAPGNLNELVRRAIEMFQRSKKADGVEWQLALENKLFSARFDEAKVEQAFVKIIENAVEALTGPNRQVRIESRNLELTRTLHDVDARLDPGQYVTVEVNDNGVGIPVEVLPRIFEPFFTTKTGHRGLGLAWVYGIITNHGGGVAVSSQIHSGTSVRIYFPAMKKIVRETGHDTSHLRGQQTILMVDDEEMLLTMGCAVLGGYGYHVLTAGSGQQALEILAQSKVPVDLVITDLVMPQMSGRELVEQIRFFCPETPILCTSGYVRPASPEEQDYYLQKPFTSYDLLSRVKQLLEGRPTETSA